MLIYNAIFNIVVHIYDLYAVYNVFDKLLTICIFI